MEWRASSKAVDVELYHPEGCLERNLLLSRARVLVQRGHVEEDTLHMLALRGPQVAHDRSERLAVWVGGNDSAPRVRDEADLAPRRAQRRHCRRRGEECGGGQVLASGEGGNRAASELAGVEEGEVAGGDSGDESVVQAAESCHESVV